jgi:hypothetical protein
MAPALDSRALEAVFSSRPDILAGIAQAAGAFCAARRSLLSAMSL